MGLIAPPVAYTLMHKIPSFAMVFYTFNTLCFALGAMDSVMQMMMGTSDEALPIMKSPQMDAFFFAFTLCNGVIAALLYPQSSMSKETVKFQQTVAAVFMFGFFPCMGFMYHSGAMGTMGIAQYGLMNAAFGGIALYNVKGLS